jgi:UDP-N-acetylmuramoyl-L-alanyl-D-glutamate--2,6-diaminopimelate ligase
MNLRDLLRNVDVVALQGDDTTDVSAVVGDSRMAGLGSLFVAIPGLQKDGATFIDAAIEKGASVIVSESAIGDRRSAVSVQVPDARAALALIAANFYGNPAAKLSLIGVTGTSGKTTTTRMIESIFDAGGEPAGLIGTIEYRAGDERLVADRTTPDAVVLQQWFAKMAGAGVRHAVMEVSSHALALERTYGVPFTAAVFTNLSRDHFDFHKDFEDYFAAKKILFTQIAGPSRAVVNEDDEYGRRLIAELGGDVLTFGRNAKIRPSPDFEISTRGLHCMLQTPHGDVRVESSLIGTPNLSNWMAAVGAALVAGIGREQIEAGIRNLHSVRGRFERVGSREDGPAVIVDYAHKPDALEKLLHAVRDLAGRKRLIIVFGCGGDRDKGKRPLMGAIAARLADQVVLTSDNPRGEPPQRIIDEIAAGITGGAPITQIPDRREAIARVIDEAPDESVVVIAGKGHEAYQVIRDQVVHFDDREEAELALMKRTLKRELKSHENILPKSN